MIRMPGTVPPRQSEQQPVPVLLLIAGAFLTMAASGALAQAAGSELVLSGRVTGPDGSPVDGATVRLGSHRRDDKNVMTQTTKPDGTCRFEEVKPGTEWLTIIKPGLAPVVQRIEIEQAGGSFDVQLNAGQTIRLRVTDAEGQPVAGAQLYPAVWNDARTLPETYEFPRTDEDGMWSWTWAPATEVQYFVRKRAVGEMLLTLSPGTDTQEVRLRFALQLHLVDTKNSPVKNARVQAWFSRSNDSMVYTSDDSGLCDVVGPAAESVCLFVDANGYRFTGAFAERTADNLTLTLTQPDEPLREPPLGTLNAVQPSDEILQRGYSAIRNLASVNGRFGIDALELLAKHDSDWFAVNPKYANLTLGQHGHQSDRMWSVAAQGLVTTNPQLAQAVVERIADPRATSLTMTRLARLVASIDVQQAENWLRQVQQAIDNIEGPTWRVEALAQVGQAWRDVGNDEAALEVLRRATSEALELDANNDRSDYSRATVAWTIAPLDTSPVLDLITIPLTPTFPDKNTEKELRRQMRDVRGLERLRLQRQVSLAFQHARYFGNVAYNIADQDPAKARRMLMAMHPNYRVEKAVPICYRMAHTDPSLAERIAPPKHPLMRAMAMGFIADAVVDKNKPRARNLIRAAYDLLHSNPEVRHRVLDASTVALGLLPSVEHIDPTFLDEAIWQSLSLHYRIHGSRNRYQHAIAAALIARFDRDLARSLGMPFDESVPDFSYLEYPTFTPGVWAAIDPDSAIEAMIRMPHDNEDRENITVRGWKQVLEVINRNPTDRWNWIVDSQLDQWYIGKFDL